MPFPFDNEPDTPQMRTECINCGHTLSGCPIKEPYIYYLAMGDVECVDVSTGETETVFALRLATQEEIDSGQAWTEVQGGWEYKCLNCGRIHDEDDMWEGHSDDW